jgi:hypothetical protein
MSTNYLLPNRFKKLGWVLLSLSIILGLYWIIYFPEPSFLDVTIPFGSDNGFLNSAKDNLFNELIGICLIISLLWVAFSKEKQEDEFINKLRLDSLVWATYFNYFILLLSMLLFYGLNFLDVMVYNLFTLLLFFIIRFNWIVNKSKKA